MRKVRPVDVVRVRELFDYNPATGVLTWRVPTSRRVKVGDIVDTPNGQGYIQVGVDSQRRLAHHIVWAHYYGKSAVGDLDHINRNRSDNRITNLREVDRTENLLNSAHENRTGFPGVVKVPSGRYVAGYHINRRRIHIGTYDTPEEAFRAYAEKHAQLYGSKSRYNKDHLNPHELLVTM